MSDIANENNLNLENNSDLDIDILSLYTGQKDIYLQNREAVKRLEKESEFLAGITLWITGASSILGLLSVINPLVSIAGSSIATLGFSREYIWRVRRLYVVAKSILDHYGDDNVVVTPRVKTDSATIDLLVRMPDKKMFALAIRAGDNRSIVWREDRQDFFALKKGKSIKKANSITRAIESLQTISYLRKIRHPLTGVTNSERNAPLIKAIVLAPGVKIIARDDSPLWVEFGEAKVLKIQTTSVTYVVKCDDLVKFLKPVKK